MQGRGVKAQGPGFESQVSKVTPSLFVSVPPWTSYSISWGNFGTCKLNPVTHLQNHPQSFLLLLAKDPNSLPWWARLPGTTLFSYLPSAQRCSFSSQVCFLSNLQTQLLCYLPPSHWQDPVPELLLLHLHKVVSSLHSGLCSMVPPADAILTILLRPPFTGNVDTFFITYSPRKIMRFMCWLANCLSPFSKV